MNNNNDVESMNEFLDLMIYFIGKGMKMSLNRLKEDHISYEFIYNASQDINSPYFERCNAILHILKEKDLNEFD